MNRLIQGLLIVAFLVPLCRALPEETMEDRKQRIMRKYLRERQVVVQSDMMVPDNEVDERVTDSEKFQQVQVDLNRKQAASPATPPRVQPIPVQTRKNWLLEAEEDPNTDPYADPFAMNSGEGNKETKSDWWTQWQARQEAMAVSQETEASRSYDYRGDAGTYARGQAGYDYSRQQERSTRASSGQYPQAGIYGQPASRQLGPYGTSSYGSAPSGMLDLPAPTQDKDAGMQSTSPGHTPYQSRLDQQREQKYSQPQPAQEFTRPTPYQEWKTGNKGWDPTADDAYLNELMQRNRR